MRVSARSLSLGVLAALGLGACSSGSYDSYQEAIETYNLTYNGCSTGKQEFKARSKDDAKRMMCDALQDDVRNKTCSRPIREEHFKKNCIGQVFKPRSQTPGTPANPTPVPVPPVRSTPVSEPPRIPTPVPTPVEPADPGLDPQTSERVKIGLYTMTVSKMNILTSGSELIRFAEQMDTCGFSYMGPKCLDSVTVGLDSAGTRINGEIVYFSRLRLAGQMTQLGLLFKVDMIKVDGLGEPFPKRQPRMQVVMIMKPRLARPLASYLQDATALQTVIDVDLDESTTNGAWRRLAAPRNLRELYHMSDIVGSSADAKAKLQSILLANKHLIQQSTDLPYQEAMVTRLYELGISADAMTEIVSPLLSSSSAAIKAIASIAVLSTQPSNTQAKQAAFSAALTHSSYKIRQAAVAAIAKASLTSAEENALLGMLADSDSDVRAEAIKAAAKVKVDERHLTKAKELSNSGHYETRVQGVLLLARIGGDEAALALIDKLEDSDSDVLKAASDALSKQTMTVAYLDKLSSKLANRNYASRLAVVALIGRIPGDASVNVLIGALGDSDSDVVNKVTEILKTKTLKEANVAALAAHLAHNTYRVRQMAVLLMGTIAGKTATTEIIKALGDSDSDVHGEAFRQLYGRKLTSENVPSLAKQFESNNYRTRLSTAKLLGKIKSSSAVEALKKQLAQESDEEVKTQLKESMKTAKP